VKCVYVGFVMCGCFDKSVDVLVLTICVLVFTPFCIVCIVFLCYFFYYIYFHLFCLY